MTDSRDITRKFDPSAGEDSGTPTPIDLPGFTFPLPVQLGRYVLTRRVGEGGMGVVYEADDKERSRSAAIKTLPEMSAHALVRLKREFRSVSDLSHPNLATLYELVSDRGVWFFAMEYIDGVDFLEYIDSVDPRARNRELRACLDQMVHGVTALHDAGLLHMDIKPDNVMVDREGRVVVLDFGLTRPQRQDEETKKGIAGTPMYIAPEVLQGTPPSPAADWYALGVMLYQALAGRPPFTGSAHQYMLAKSYRDPSPPSAFRAGLPADLEGLCLALLSRDPDARPQGPAILERLQTLTDHDRMLSVTLHPVDGQAFFVGREQQLDEITDAWESTSGGEPFVALVHGTSGIGKTMLMRKALSRLQHESGVLVLGGRCYERETVPFKAFDSLIDALGAHVQGLSEKVASDILSPALNDTARLFPALQPLAWRSPGADNAAQEPREVRRRAVQGLRDLLDGLCRIAPVALWIDDLQWGDLDSAYLLTELLAPPGAPPVFVCCTYRDEEADSSAMLAELRENADRLPRSREIELAPLSDSDARRLALHLLGEENNATRRIAEAIALEARGIPFFVEELARLATDRDLGNADRAQMLASLSVDHAIETRVQAVSEPARELLELIVLAGTPIEQGVLLRAASVGGDPDALLASLRSARLVRTSGVRDADVVESYHDRIREGVSHLLPRDRTLRGHLRLAKTYESLGDSEPELLAKHFHGANELQRAGHYAESAGVRAAEAMAFERAAEFFQQALEWGEEDAVRARRVREQLADALVAAGHCARSAPVFVAAARDATAEDAALLRCHAAEQYLASGHLTDGEALLRPLCRDYGITYPRRPLPATLLTLLRLLWLRIRGTGYRRRNVGDLAPAALLRADLCWSAAKGLSPTDTIRGGYFLLTGLLAALRLGEEQRIVRTMATFASAVLSPVGGQLSAWGRRLLDQCHAIADASDDAYLRGVTAVGRGHFQLHEGHFDAALETTDAGIELLRSHCTGVAWEVNLGTMCGLRALQELGRFQEFCQRADDAYLEAEERGDQYMQATARLYRAIGRVAEADLGRARAEAQAILGTWTAEDYLHIQHLYAHSILVMCDLGEDAPERGWLRITRLWPALERSRLLKVSVMRVDCLAMRSRCALALAAAGDPRQAKLLAACRADQRQLAREGRTDTGAIAAQMGAGIANIERDDETTSKLLQEAAAAFEEAGQPLHATIARYRLLELAARSADREAIARSADRMREMGIGDPAQWVAIQAPGFRADTRTPPT